MERSESFYSSTHRVLIYQVVFFSPVPLSSSRFRDSALRGIALASSASYNLWYGFLLQTVTFEPKNVKDLLFLLGRDPTLGHQARSLIQAGTEGEEELDGTSFSRPLSKTPNLEILVLRDILVSFSFVEIISEKTVPLQFLSQSLKRIFLPASPEGDPFPLISLKNIVWLLVFCSGLYQAALSFSIDVQDIKFLQNHEATLEGTSKVNSSPSSRSSGGKSTISDFGGEGLERIRAIGREETEKTRRFIDSSKLRDSSYLLS